jgi:Helicase conserved C-terminal domain
LKRRLLMLTLHEALLRDRELDIKERERLYDEARDLIHVEWDLGRDAIGRSEVDRVMADLKFKLAKKLDDEVLELASDPYATEFAASNAEDLAATAVDLALPEERLRIADLLGSFPIIRETKIQKLLDGLGTLWRQNDKEKIVIFATYIGTVDLISREIEKVYPGQGVTVLRGGDHGAKLAAERRFRSKDGPRVLVCTAAGREGINLQFARILFNFDLPWNPMDMEQRIGRIHRYGQMHTAQVYNLVLSDTIEGRIFLMLDEKLTEIARTLGKVDAQGNVAEDLRGQILGQLSERLNYDRLYQEALSDPTLKRTAVELDAALENAREARVVVFDLFQDLDGFSLDDYKPFADVSKGLERIVDFLSVAIAERNGSLKKIDKDSFELSLNDGTSVVKFTLDRTVATAKEGIELIGVDHPIVRDEIRKWRDQAPEQLGISVLSDVPTKSILTVWLVEFMANSGGKRVVLLPISTLENGSRGPLIERMPEKFFRSKQSTPWLDFDSRNAVFSEYIEPSLLRELQHKGAANGHGSYLAELVAYIEIAPQ